MSEFSRQIHEDAQAMSHALSRLICGDTFCGVIADEEGAEMSRTEDKVIVFESSEVCAIRAESYDGRECILTIEGNANDNVFSHFPLSAQQLRDIAGVLVRAADEMDKAAQ